MEASPRFAEAVVSLGKPKLGSLSRGTAFGASHKFQVIMFLLLFVSRNFLISIFISSVTCLLFRNILFNLNMFVVFNFFPVTDI